MKLEVRVLLAGMGGRLRILNISNRHQPIGLGSSRCWPDQFQGLLTRHESILIYVIRLIWEILKICSVGWRINIVIGFHPGSVFLLVVWGAWWLLADEGPGSEKTCLAAQSSNWLVIDMNITIEVGDRIHVEVWGLIHPILLKEPRRLLRHALDMHM